MATLTVTDKQLRLIQQALEFYSRIGIGQLDEIKEHPTFYKYLIEQVKDVDGEVDFQKYHLIRKQADNAFTQGRNTLWNDFNRGTNGSWGIHNPNVDESCRVAYDLIQVIRHEFWKSNPDRKNFTVDSSVLLYTEDGDKIKCEI
jgi:hypothetical protein